MAIPTQTFTVICGTRKPNPLIRTESKSTSLQGMAGTRFTSSLRFIWLSPLPQAPTTNGTDNDGPRTFSRWSPVPYNQNECSGLPRGQVTSKLELENSKTRWSYNDLPGETEAGLCRKATMPRDNRVGSSSRCLAARHALLSRCSLTGDSCLENPRPKGGILTNGNVASPFHAEPRHEPSMSPNPKS